MRTYHCDMPSISAVSTRERHIQEVEFLVPVNTSKAAAKQFTTIEDLELERIYNPELVRAIPPLSFTETHLKVLIEQRIPPPMPKLKAKPKPRRKYVGIDEDEAEASFSEESAEESAAGGDSDDAWLPKSEARALKKKKRAPKAEGPAMVGVSALTGRSRRRRRAEEEDDDDFVQPPRKKADDGFVRRSTRSRATASNEYPDSELEEEEEEPQPQEPVDEPVPDLFSIEHIWEHANLSPEMAAAMVPSSRIRPDQLSASGKANLEAYLQAVNSGETPTARPGALPPTMPEDYDGELMVAENGPPYMAMRVKWKGLSYVHCTWENISDLVLLRSYNRVINYFKQVDAHYDRVAQAAEEDKEEILVEYEMQKRQYELHCKVERIINVRTVEVDTHKRRHEYLVKWKGLDYKACTWEEKDVVDANGKTAFDTMVYYQRQLQNIYAKPIPAFGERPPFRPMETQPAYFPQGLQLRDYQLTGLNFLAAAWHQRRGVILADEMGLGKTIQCSAILGYLHTMCHSPGPFLVVVPLSTIAAWQKELKTWAPFFNVITFIGDAKSREVCIENEFKTMVYVHSRREKATVPKFQVMLTTYEQSSNNEEILRAFQWRGLVVDEAHRLKNNESVLYRSLQRFKTDWRCLVTGTPLQNSVKELWALLHFIAPQTFPSAQEFEEKYGDPNNQDQIGELHKVLQPYMLRREKKDVEKSLPPKTERILRVGLAPLQKDYYKWIITRNLGELSKNTKAKHSLINIMVQLKKVCNHPFLFDGARERVWQGGVAQSVDDHIKGITSTCGKMRLLDQLLNKLKADGHRVLIFSQMVMMLDVISEYLRAKRFKFQRLDGSTNAEDRRKAMHAFNSPESDDFVFILSTKAGGLGINLQTADTVIVFDSDWNPQNDLQAQARAHRIGQQKSVNIYRFVTKDTIEENIVERAKKKMILDHLIIQRLDAKGDGTEQNSTASALIQQKNGPNDFTRDELGAILKFGAERLFTDEHKDEEEAEDLDDILARAEEREAPEGEKTGASEAFLAGFKVTDMKFDDDGENDASFWNRLIPEDQRVKDEQAASGQEVLAPRRARMKGIYGLEEEEEDEAPPAPTERFMSHKDIRTMIARIKRWPHGDFTDQIIADPSLSDYFADAEQARETIEQILNLAQEAADASEADAKGRHKATATFQGVPFDAIDMITKAQDLALIRRHVHDDKFAWPVRVAKPSWAGSFKWTSRHDTLLLLRVVDAGFVSDEKQLIVDRKRWPTDFRPGSYHKRVRALLNALAKTEPKSMRAIKRKGAPGTAVKAEKRAHTADDGDGDEPQYDSEIIIPERARIDEGLIELGAALLKRIRDTDVKPVQLALSTHGPELTALKSWSTDQQKALARLAGTVAQIVAESTAEPDIRAAIKFCWLMLASRFYRKTLQQVLGWPDILNYAGDMTSVVTRECVGKLGNGISLAADPTHDPSHLYDDHYVISDQPETRDASAVSKALKLDSYKSRTGLRLVVEVNRKAMEKAVENRGMPRRK
ncbi:SNF2 family N-terminal domain [Carpediemonas membranifera]|uniref:SNF2 family N-terminal domain n=1 Tax=Carpediemonas membranifera TaxID=201153 RepID=A0A8J6B3S0_9EUKA|nr:SNF2 family N-terminal domain [Carpediemonas membranifera]|eukprot:KAG9393679.1 SNF2 family N-terminal domain [Carpediemonas membranifera]